MGRIEKSTLKNKKKWKFQQFWSPLHKLPQLAEFINGWLITGGQLLLRHSTLHQTNGINFKPLLIPSTNQSFHHFSTGAIPTAIQKSVPKNRSTAQRKELIILICQMTIKCISTNSPKNTGTWSMKTNTPWPVSLQSTQVLSSRLSMLTPMVFSIMAKSMHGMRPPIKCSPNGTGLHLTNSLPVQHRHGRILKWTVMRPLGPKQNLPNSV